ncbi:response regulator [Novosphingobium sp.]|uniref:response regulator n=1 Tax=Novosphingobium sp. TaxID=1874826 RepID=UPI002617F8B9|nr:response regulator [Novosphingobium sp.]
MSNDRVCSRIVGYGESQVGRLACIILGNFLQKQLSGKPLVLVVEDGILVAMAIEDALIDRGMDVAVATTLANARALVGQRIPDAVLLDLQLPDGHTLDLASTLHAQGCAVAFSSAFGEEAVPASHDFAYHFKKPVSADFLADWVVEALWQQQNPQRHGSGS